MLGTSRYRGRSGRSAPALRRLGGSPVDGFDRSDLRGRRGVGDQRAFERSEIFFRALGMDLDPGLVVADPPAEPVAVRQAVGERPKTDALHGAANPDYAGDT